MDSEKAWTPQGAAARLFKGTSVSSTVEHSFLPSYPRDIRRRVVEADDAPEDGDAIFHAAWEIARCAAPLPDEQHRAVLLLALAVASASREGNTRIPLGNTAQLHERLAALGASDADLQTVDAVLSEVRHRLSRRASVPASDDAIPFSMDAVFGFPGERRPLLIDGDWLSSQRLQVAEERFVSAILERLKPLGALAESGPSFIDVSGIESALESVVALPPAPGGREVKLSDEQTQAIRMAAGRRLSLVTGGPGTGKTSIVVSLLRVLVRLGVEPKDIVLAAPTGKAANRLEESARSYLSAIPNPAPEDRLLIAQGTAPRTLHRLLGFSPSRGTFRHHARHAIPEKVIVVDESSMIDLLLMERLLRAVAPDAMLVLLGDAEQLPSVDAGAVFRDLSNDDVWPGESPAVRLTRSYRMRQDDPDGVRVLTSARAINAGDVNALFGTGEAPAPLATRTAVECIEFRGVELLETTSDPKHRPSTLERFLARWWEDRLKWEGDAAAAATRVLRYGAHGFSPEDERCIRALLAHHDAQRVLCLTRVDPIAGSRAVNDYFHDRLGEGDRGPVSRARGGSPSFLPGEPVMVQRNDYVRSLFNGDQGVVVRGAEAGGTPRLMVVFTRGEALEVHPLESIQADLTLCYAMTVHKSQGSEYGTVALLLPDRENSLLSREILYTAVTRARKSVVIVGDRQILGSGVARSMERYSGVADRLRKASHSGA